MKINNNTTFREILSLYRASLGSIMLNFQYALVLNFISCDEDDDNDGDDDKNKITYVHLTARTVDLYFLSITSTSFSFFMFFFFCRALHLPMSLPIFCRIVYFRNGRWLLYILYIHHFLQVFVLWSNVNAIEFYSQLPANAITRLSKVTLYVRIHTVEINNLNSTKYSYVVQCVCASERTLRAAINVNVNTCTREEVNT